MYVNLFSFNLKKDDKTKIIYNSDFGAKYNIAPPTLTGKNSLSKY